MNANFFIKWTATAVTIAFAVLTSLNITPANVWLGNISSMIWLWWALRIKEWSLVVVNAMLLAVYMVGLFVGK